MTEIEGPRGTYRPCLTCHAPIVDPFPEAWKIELIKEGPPQGPVKSFITPHRDTCDAPDADPQPGVAIRLPGRVVASIGFDLHGVPLDEPRPDPPPKVFQPPAHGWQIVGYTDAGMISEDGVTWTRPPDEPPELPSARFTLGPGVGYWATSDIAAGQTVRMTSGPDGNFAKPVVPYDLDAAPPDPDPPAVEP